VLDVHALPAVSDPSEERHAVVVGVGDDQPAIARVEGERLRRSGSREAQVMGLSARSASRSVILLGESGLRSAKQDCGADDNEQYCFTVQSHHRTPTAVYENGLRTTQDLEGALVEM
jgi:hypothetical protein